MKGLDFSGFKKILVLAAHCDDVEIGCYGFLSKLKAKGAQIQAIILSGSESRKDEQRKSFETWGAISIYTIGDFSDGLFPTEVAEIKAFIRQEIAQHTYDCILTHCREDQHQDHLALANLAYNLFRDDLILEYEIPKYDVDTIRPNVFVGLDEAQIQAKCAHLESNFESQATKPWYTPDTFKGLAKLRGIQCNMPFAEAFVCRKVILAS